MKKTIVALDLGFGDVKLVAPDHTTSKFPSCISVCSTNGIDLGYEEPNVFQFAAGKTVARKYRIGDRSEAMSFLEFEAMCDFAPLLTFKALTDLSDFGDIDILAVGLPLNYWKPHREAFAAMLKTVEANGRKITCGEVKVFPQGVAALVDMQRGFDGRPLARKQPKNALVVDVGFNTIDTVIIKDGRVTPSNCDMTERSGLSEVALAIGAHISSHYKRKASAQACMKILAEGHMSHWGKDVDLTGVCHSILTAYADSLFADLKDRHASLLTEADSLVITGGGGHYLAKHIPDKFRSIAVITEAPEYSNARGFFKLAMKD